METIKIKQNWVSESLNYFSEKSQIEFLRYDFYIIYLYILYEIGPKKFYKNFKKHVIRLFGVSLVKSVMH